eukprot:COSAG02_NODE_21820_length_774_cov_0.853333_1_plen_91_part_00
MSLGRTSRGPQHRDTHKDYLLNHSAGGEQWVQASDGLHPGKVLRHVGPVAVYGPFLEWLVSSVRQSPCLDDGHAILLGLRRGTLSGGYRG